MTKGKSDVLPASAVRVSRNASRAPLPAVASGRSIGERAVGLDDLERVLDLWLALGRRAAEPRGEQRLLEALLARRAARGMRLTHIRPGEVLDTEMLHAIEVLVAITAERLVIPDRLSPWSRGAQ